MPLILTRSDVHALADSDEDLDDAIDAVEQSILASHAGDAGEAVFAGLSLRNGDEFAVNYVTSASGPACVRLFPRRLSGERPNAWLGIEVGVDSGEVETMIALNDLNMLRTSIPAAVGVRHLASAAATTLAVLGSGLQAVSDIRAMSRVLPHLTTIRVWSPDRDHRDELARHLDDTTRFDVVRCDSAEQAAACADVIAAAGLLKGGQPAVHDPNAVRPGALLVSVTGSGNNLIEHGARAVVPTKQAPELVAHGFSSGFMRQPPPQPPGDVLELAEVILGNRPARADDGQTLVYELATVYLWDIPILQWIRRWATARGLGSHIDFSA